jgi:hypothetical protein
MANDFDRFPLGDPITQNGSLLSDQWYTFMSMFYENLITYLSSSGIFLPNLTTAQRDALVAPALGQMIYNTTNNDVEVWQIKAGTGAWRAVTTVP